MLREAPTVRIEVQFVDSQGRPALGGAARGFGRFPMHRRSPTRAAPIARSVTGWPRTINDPEPQDTSDRIDWSMQDRPDADGRIIFRVPEGLRKATLNAYASDETIAYKTRLEEHEPLKFWGGGQLGTTRRQIARSRSSATGHQRSILTVKTDDDRTPEKKVDVCANFVFNLGGYGESFIRQADGRYRSHSLMPDHEYSIVAASARLYPRDGSRG